MDLITIIMTIIIWVVIWNIIKSLFFSNAIVSFKSYYGTLFGCFIAGCVITEGIIDWFIFLFNFFYDTIETFMSKLYIPIQY